MKRTLAVLLVALAASACREGSDRISRERFVEANVALRLLPADATAEDRAQVLERYRVTSAELHAWLRDHEDDPAFLARTWRQVSARLDSVAEAAGRPEPLEGTLPELPDPFSEEPLVGPGVKDGALGVDEPRLPDLPEALDLPRPPQPTGPPSRVVIPPPPD